tara:strand:- start:75 stop:245 length:171 start_codon:yes stop_codon:yes gene_type:complete
MTTMWMSDDFVDIKLLCILTKIAWLMRRTMSIETTSWSGAVVVCVASLDLMVSQML